jgi:hypothetical protein
LDGFRNNTIGSCGGSGPERVYHFALQQKSHVRVEDSHVDTVVYIRNGCDATALELACDNRGGEQGGSLVHAYLNPGDYYVFVDSDAGLDTKANIAISFEFEVLHGATCDDAEEVAIENQTIHASLDGYTGDSIGSCKGRGPERVCSFVLDEPMSFTAESSGFDSVMYLRDGCGTTTWSIRFPSRLRRWHGSLGRRGRS